MKLLWPKWEDKNLSSHANSTAFIVTSHIAQAGLYVGLAILAVTLFRLREKLALFLKLKMLALENMACLPEGCDEESLVGAWPLFVFLFVAVLTATFVFSKGFREQALKLSMLLGILLAFGALKNYFFPQASEFWFLFAANLLQAFYVAKSEGAESLRDAGAANPPDRETAMAPSDTRVTASALGLAWAGLLVTGIFLWNQSGPNTHRDSSSEWTGEVSPSTPGMPRAAEPWLAAIEALDVAALRELAARKDNLSIFADPVWGKFLFFRAAEAGPAVLNYILTLRAIPLDVLGDGRRRLASSNDCEGLRTINRFGDRQRPKPVWPRIPCDVKRQPR